MHRSEVRLPLEYVARPRIRRVRTAVTGRDIFEELHSGTGGCAQSRDTETRAKHVVQMLLFGAVVFAFTNLLQSKKISIESQASFRVADDDRRVVDPQEQFLRLRAIALALRVLRLRAIALALRVLRLRAIALALRVGLAFAPLIGSFAPTGLDLKNNIFPGLTPGATYCRRSAAQ